MKFVALYTGEGDGCDYTIGCNQKSEVFEADSIEEALKVCEQEWEDNGGECGDSRIKEIQLFLIGSEIAVDMSNWGGEEKKRRERVRQELAEAEEKVRRLRNQLS